MAVIKGYWKTLLIALAILYGSLLREPHFSLPLIDYSDKWVHLLVYALLGAMACWDSMRSSTSVVRIVLIGLVLPVLYGGVLELVQEWWFYPRTGDWFDWLADGMGVLLGCGIATIIARIKPKRE